MENKKIKMKETISPRVESEFDEKNLLNLNTVKLILLN